MVTAETEEEIETEKWDQAGQRVRGQRGLGQTNIRMGFISGDQFS